MLTDLDNARAFLKLPPSHVTYIVCKCRAEANVQNVVQQLRDTIPEHEILTTQSYHDQCSEFWVTNSGIGPVILMSSVLGVLVGFLIVTLTFYISTIEKLPVYACLKALGASLREVVVILAFQVVLVFVLGGAIAAACLHFVLIGLRTTTISVIITPSLVAGGLGTMLLCSAVGSLLSMRRLVTTDPGEAFRT